MPIHAHTYTFIHSFSFFKTSVFTKQVFSSKQFHFFYIILSILAVITYFEQNWLPIQQQWAKFHISKHLIFGNDTNNRLESTNQKLKAIITKYSSMNAFTRLLISCVSSIHIEKDIKTAEQLMRQPIKTFDYAPHDRDYLRIMTKFAFDNYVRERMATARVQFHHIDAVMAVSGTAGNRCFTDEKKCDCLFSSSMGIPCRHILAFREHNNLNLFEPTLINERWLKQKLITLSQLDYVLDNEPNVEIIDGTASQEPQSRKKKTPAQKFRMAQNKCDELCGLLSELPEAQFIEKYKLLCDLAMNVRAIADVPNDEGNFCNIFILFTLFWLTNNVSPARRANNQPVPGVQLVEVSVRLDRIQFDSSGRPIIPQAQGIFFFTNIFFLYKIGKIF